MIFAFGEQKRFLISFKEGEINMLGKILGFFTNLFFNLVLNIEGIIPALILLALHYFFDFSLLWFWIALGVWVLGIVIRMLFLGFAMKCSNMPDKHLDNVNPYSAKDIKIRKKSYLENIESSDKSKE